MFSSNDEQEPSEGKLNCKLIVSLLYLFVVSE